MSTLKRCDVCGEVYELPTSLHAGFPNILSVSCVANNGDILEPKNYDLCARCMKKIYDILKPQSKKGGK